MVRIEDPCISPIDVQMYLNRVEDTYHQPTDGDGNDIGSPVLVFEPLYEYKLGAAVTQFPVYLDDLSYLNHDIDCKQKKITFYDQNFIDTSVPPSWFEASAFTFKTTKFDDVGSLGRYDVFYKIEMIQYLGNE